MTQPSLLDLLEPAPQDVLHALMPNMGLACGADLLALLRHPHKRGSVYALRYEQVTCDACRRAASTPGAANSKAANPTLRKNHGLILILRPR